MAWCDLDLTFDLAVVTLTYKILFGLCLGFHKVQNIDTWEGHWLGGVCKCIYASWCDLFALLRCSAAIFETSFSYDNDIWIAATDY